VTGDTVERPFKIMGCGGLTVLDTPSYRELFTDDEVLMPANAAQYHDIVRTVLQNPAAYAHYRHTGYEAVLGRHTYVHRAKTIMQELGL